MINVDQDYFWSLDMASCPRGVKLQLLGLGGVAVYSVYTGDTFWRGWARLPKVPEVGDGGAECDAVGSGTGVLHCRTK